MQIRNSHQRLWVVIFLLPALVMFGLFFIGPIITVVTTSFTKWNGLSPPKFIGTANYLRLLSSDAVHSAFWNSMKWVLAAALIHVPFGVLVALILSKKQRGWRFTRAVFMIPNIIGWTALSLLFRFIYMPESGIINGLFRLFGATDFQHNWLAHPDTAFFSVTSIWLFYAAVITLITLSEILAIPESIHDSAKIDGASNIQIDLYINLPMIRPIIGTGIIIAVTSVLKQFEIVYLTTSGGPGNKTTLLSVLMYNRLFNGMEHGYANALGILLMVTGIILVLSLQRIFRLSRGYSE